jgi:putative ABC transport system permease protein
MDKFFIVEGILRRYPQYVPYLYAAIGGLVLLLAVLAFLYRKYCGFVFKSLFRNKVRTALTAVATMVLVFVVTLVWTVLCFLDIVMTERSKDLKAIVTEKFQIPSQMPYAYAGRLETESQTLPEGMRPGPDDLMGWTFYGGTTDPDKRTRENMLFFFALKPRTLLTMMDDTEKLDPALVRKMEEKPDGVILGRDRLKAINKRVGERFGVTSLNFKGIDLDFEIVGTFPEGRYDQSAAMNIDYLLNKLDDYKNKNKGVAHPMAERALNLYWLRLPTTAAFEEYAADVGQPGKFASPAVKVETASSGISSWLDGYRDLIWGMRWLLTPAILFTMALVIANAISISVRERRTEMAVLKVLGYGPGRILALVLGEALLIGAGSGFLSALLSYLLVHQLMGGIKFPVAFFPSFDIYIDALWWGILIGGGTALVGSLVPAWSARSVKVSEVFAKVA